MKILKFKEFLKAPDLSTREVGAIMLNKEVDPFRLSLYLFYIEKILHLNIYINSNVI